MRRRSPLLPLGPLHACMPPCNSSSRGCCPHSTLSRGQTALASQGCACPHDGDAGKADNMAVWCITTRRSSQRRRRVALARRALHGGGVGARPQSAATKTTATMTARRAARSLQRRAVQLRSGMGWHGGPTCPWARHDTVESP